MQEIPKLVNNEGFGFATNVQEFKLLGLTLGDIYTGKIDRNWNDPKIEEKYSQDFYYRQESSALEKHLYKNPIFLRVKAFNDLGEIGILLSPKANIILKTVLIKEIKNNDISVMSDFIVDIVNGCRGFDRTTMDSIANLIRKQQKFVLDEDEKVNSNPDYSSCGISASGGINFLGFYSANISINSGEKKTYQEGTRSIKKYQYPANLNIYIGEGMVKMNFYDYRISGRTDGTGYFPNGSALFAKIQKHPDQILNEDNESAVNDGDPEAILLKAQAERDPRETLKLLEKIELISIKARVLAGKIYLGNAGVPRVNDYKNKLELSQDNSFKEALKRLKPAADAGNKEAKILLSEMYEYGFGVDKNLKIAAKLIIEGDSENGGKLFDFCISGGHTELIECSSIVKKNENDKKIKLARDTADMKNYTIVASCFGPLREYIRTIMSLANEPLAMMQSINSAGRFCSLSNTPLNNVEILLRKELISRNTNGAIFYISETSNPNVMIGLVRRPN